MSETVDKLQYEREYQSNGYSLIAGVDEVGRGPLAGPVVCCAVIMPLSEQDIIAGVDDSKKLSEKKRKNLDKLIREKAIALAVCEIQAQEIDSINILEATKKCMAQCIANLQVKPKAVFVDALQIDTGDAVCVPIIKGDFKSYTIGCASIVAKVYRDALMEKYALDYPEYGFEKHKGYGTVMHINAIKEIGPCPLHRRTFIKNFWDDKGNVKPKYI